MLMDSALVQAQRKGLLMLSERVNSSQALALMPTSLKWSAFATWWRSFLTSASEFTSTRWREDRVCRGRKFGHWWEKTVACKITNFPGCYEKEPFPRANWKPSWTLRSPRYRNWPGRVLRISTLKAINIWPISTYF